MNTFTIEKSKNLYLIFGIISLLHIKDRDSIQEKRKECIYYHAKTGYIGVSSNLKGSNKGCK